jgi:hypothetical protein
VFILDMSSPNYSSPPTDLEVVLASEIKSVFLRPLWGRALTAILLQGMALPLVFRDLPPILPSEKLADIYFHQKNQGEHRAALDLRDAVLRLRRDGAFVAVPLFRVNEQPMGPHPVGEILDNQIFIS